MARNTILLVGGELCQRVASKLDPDTWRIQGLRRHPPGGTSTRWIRADLSIPATLRNLPDGITHVLYAPAPDARTPVDYDAVYPLGLGHLLNALERQTGLRRVVLVVSTAVWPAAEPAFPDVWVDEETPASCNDYRARAMLQAEALLLRRLPQQSTALRLGGIYGPGRTRLLDNLRAGRLVAPDGPGHWSNRIHIDDAASACVHLLGLPQLQPCYIGTDGHPTDKDWFTTVWQSCSRCHTLHIKPWHPVASV